MCRAWLCRRRPVTLPLLPRLSCRPRAAEASQPGFFSRAFAVDGFAQGSCPTSVTRNISRRSMAPQTWQTLFGQPQPCRQAPRTITCTNSAAQHLRLPQPTTHHRRRAAGCSAEYTAHLICLLSAPLLPTRRRLLLTRTRDERDEVSAAPAIGVLPGSGRGGAGPWAVRLAERGRERSSSPGQEATRHHRPARRGASIPPSLPAGFFLVTARELRCVHDRVVPCSMSPLAPAGAVPCAHVWGGGTGRQGCGGSYDVHDKLPCSSHARN